MDENGRTLTTWFDDKFELTNGDDQWQTVELPEEYIDSKMILSYLSCLIYLERFYEFYDII